MLVEFDEFHVGAALPEDLRLAACLRDMGADEDDAPVPVVAVDEVGPRQEGDVADTAEHLRQGGRAAEEELLSLRKGPAECGGEDCDVAVVRAVGDDFPEAGSRRQLRRNAFGVAGAQFVQADPAAALRGEGAASFLLDPVGEEGTPVAEAPVPGKLGLPGGDQPLPLQDVVHAPKRIAAALREEGIDHLAVKAFAGLRLQLRPEDLGLHRPVAAEGGVPPAEDEEILPGRLRGGSDVLRRFRMEGAALRRGQAAGVCEDEEHLLRSAESLQNGLVIPAGIDVHAVDGLHAGRVVVEDDDFAVHRAERGGGERGGVAGVRRQLREDAACQSFRRAHHGSGQVTVSMRITLVLPLCPLVLPPVMTTVSPLSSCSTSLTALSA